MTCKLSIIPAFLFAALLVTGCYDADAFYDPADPEELLEQTWEEEQDEVVEPGDEADEAQDEVEEPEDWSADEPEEPQEVEPEDCAFGEHVSDLADDHVVAGAFDHVFAPGELTETEEQMLQLGIELWSWFHVEEAPDLFDVIDDGRLLVRELELLDSGALFTHLRFHVHGAEYGYLFTRDGARLAASVEEGWIVGCTVSN